MLVDKIEGKRQVGRCRRTREDNVKTGLEEAGCEDLD